jgi:hypothetical protein
MKAKNQFTNKKLGREELKDILGKLPGERVSISELQSVASDLGNPDELYLRASILAKSFNARFIPALEQLVFNTTDPDVAGVAIRALVDFHGRTEYLPVLVKFMQGVSWDITDGLKFRSIQIAGLVLRSNKNSELISLLIKSFEQSKDASIREASHEALMAAADVDRTDVSTRIAARGMTQNDLRLDVVEELKNQLRQASEQKIN